jgi:O-antigen/teichoic acid export membrane protein
MKEVALFIVPLDILMRISFIYGSIGAVFFPIFSKTLAQKDPLKFLSLYNKSYFLIFSLVGLIICFLVLFSSELLSLWLGSDFDSHELSIIIAIAIMFTGLTVIPGRALISLKKEKMLGIFYLAGSLLYIPSSYLLINTYGVNGAAYAFLSRSIIELFVLNILVAYSMKKIFVERTVKYVKLSLYSFLPLIFFFIAFLSNIDVLYKILILFLVMIIACSIIYKIFKSLDSLKINT